MVGVTRWHQLGADFSPNSLPMSAHNVVNERTGLLNGGQRPSKSDPMDLSAAQRYGILAALWLGTFIGVSTNQPC